MQDSLRLVFIFVGIIAIGALLAHGFWSNRKKRFTENETYSKEIDFDNIKIGNYTELEPAFDADGVGKVRTLSANKESVDVFVSSAESLPSIPVSKSASGSEPEPKMTAYELKQDALCENTKTNALHFSATAFDEVADLASNFAVEADVEANVEAEIQFAPPPKSLLKNPETHGVETLNHSLASIATGAQAVVQANVTQKASIDRAEPNLFAVKVPPPVLVEKPAQVQIDTGAPNVSRSHEQAAKLEPSIAPASSSVAKPQGPKSQAQPQDVYILNVAAKEGNMIEGAKLLPLLLRLGFKFGDMDIFHRHQDAAGNGHILFSLASMVKPGIFDLDTMEQFSTQGVTLFFTVPCSGSASSNYKLMLQAAQKLSTWLDAQLLDQHRNPLNDQAIRHTMNKVLEFERLQLLGGKRP